MIKVYIVTSVDYGWDCIVGVFNTEYVSREQLETRYPAYRGYCIFERNAETEIDED